MKTGRFLFIATALLCSCSRDYLNSDSIVNRLYVEPASASKVQLNEEYKTVWNYGDKVSVFHQGASNQCWTYKGTDKSSSGIIEYTGEKVTSTDKVAVYPYREGLNLGDNKITGLEIAERQAFAKGTFPSAILAAKTGDATLRFKYTQAFVKINISGFGSLYGLKVKARGGEPLAGQASLDFSGEKPILSISKDSKCDSIYVKNISGTALAMLSGKTISTFIPVPAGIYSDGLDVSVTGANGKTRIVHYTGETTLSAGEFLNVDSFVEYETSITVDFNNNNNPFVEALPTGSFKDASQNDKTYSLLGSTYKFFLHAEQNTTATGWGYYLSATKGLVIGRELSYIRFPKIANHIVSRIVYTAGSGGGSPFITATDSGIAPTKSDRVSNIGGSTEAGKNYEIASWGEVEDKDYSLCVGGGNLCILKIDIYYKKLR